jgi:trigger factor
MEEDASAPLPLCPPAPLGFKSIYQSISEEMTTDIEVTKAGAEPGAASFKIKVPVERVAKAERSAAQTFAKRARLPGFRKGKAPLEVVRKRFHDAIREQVLREVIGDSWKLTLEQEDLHPIADPRVNDVKFESGVPLTFELHVEVKPDLKLERIGGFNINRAVAPVTDEAVDLQIDDLRLQRAPWVPVDDDRPKTEQMASVTLATIEDGEPRDPKQYQVVLGEGQAIPDVEEAILQLAVGETVDTPVRFPDDFPDETKRGQSRQVRLTLHEIKRRDLPALDDAFAREVGDFESLSDLRSAVRHDLELDARRQADADARRQLVEQIVAANNVPAPRPLVERLLSAYAQSYEVPDEHLESFRTEFRPIGEAQVKRDLVLDWVTTDQKLQVSEEELDQRIAEIAKQSKSEPGEVYAGLQKANRLKELEHSITEKKVFDYLMSQSTVTES